MWKRLDSQLWCYNAPLRCSLQWKYVWTQPRSMGLLPDTRNCGCACARNAGNVFPVTAGERSRHASRHVRHVLDARAVMHAGIINYRFPLKSAAGENVPGIPGACATCNFTYLVRGPWNIWIHQLPRENVSTMSSAIVGHNICSVDILLTFIYFYANVMSWHYRTILVGLGPSFTTPYHIIVTKWVSWTIPADDPDHNILF